jgi:hypothetical protein
MKYLLVKSINKLAQDAMMFGLVSGILYILGVVFYFGYTYKF